MYVAFCLHQPPPLRAPMSLKCLSRQLSGGVATNLGEVAPRNGLPL